MVLPRKFREIILGILLLGLPILFLQANLKSPPDLNPLDRVILKISSPLQALFTSIFSGIHRTWSRYVYLVGVEKDNERLSNENFRLKTEVRQVERNLKRLKHLEKLLAFRNEKAVETIGVKVIGRDASPFVRIVRVKIDRGKGTLRSGLPVITAEGVVGRIGRTYGLYSDVILAVDPKSAIDVVVQRTGSRGVLRGIDGANRCRIDYLLRKEEVKAGDLVITSGVEGIFPTGIPVGRISRVTKRNYKLYQDVEVTPTVDYTALREMLVILAPPPPDASHEVAGIQPARGVLP